VLVQVLVLQRGRVWGLTVQRVMGRMMKTTMMMMTTMLLRSPLGTALSNRRIHRRSLLYPK